MNGFTKENTAEATHIYTGTYAQFEKTEGKIRFVLNKQTKFEWLDSGSADEIGYDCLELSRPIGERREDFLIPISYVKKFTPLIAGDILFVTGRHEPGHAFDLKSEGHANRFNNNKMNNDFHYFVVSFADRPNTVKQPVGDDVVVDVVYSTGAKFTVKAKAPGWLTEETETAAATMSWKPSHAAMLKQYQAEQGEKHHIELQTKATGEPDSLDFVINEDKAANDDVVSEKPAYTQAMKDAELTSNEKELMRLVDFVWSNKLIRDGENPVGCVIRELSEKHDIDNRTDDQKIRDELEDIFAAPGAYDYDIGPAVSQALKSDKITITLNG